jgi:hypothetical protein
MKKFLKIIIYHTVLLSQQSMINAKFWDTVRQHLPNIRNLNSLSEKYLLHCTFCSSHSRFTRTMTNTKFDTPFLLCTLYECFYVILFWHDKLPYEINLKLRFKCWNWQSRHEIPMHTLTRAIKTTKYNCFLTYLLVLFSQETWYWHFNFFSNNASFIIYTHKNNLAFSRRYPSFILATHCCSLIIQHQEFYSF